MFPEHDDQFFEFCGGSLAAGFFFDCAQDMQVKGLCKIIESIMECDQFPTGQNEDGTWYIDLSVNAIATKRINASEITIQGDVSIYPVIRIQNNSGGTTELLTDYGLEIVNNTTGCRIFLDYKTDPGEVVTIDLPNRRVVSSKNGNIAQHLSDDTILEDFVLELGTNEIEAINYNTNEDISVVMEYSNQYAMVVI